MADIKGTNSLPLEKREAKTASSLFILTKRGCGSFIKNIVKPCRSITSTKTRLNMVH